MNLNTKVGRSCCRGRKSVEHLFFSSISRVTQDLKTKNIDFFTATACTQRALWTESCMHLFPWLWECFHKCLQFVVMQVLHHCQNQCATTWHVLMGNLANFNGGLLKNTCNFDGEMFFLFQNDYQLLNIDSKDALKDFNLINFLIV